MLFLWTEITNAYSIVHEHFKSSHVKILENSASYKGDSTSMEFLLSRLYLILCQNFPTQIIPHRNAYACKQKGPYSWAHSVLNFFKRKNLTGILAVSLHINVSKVNFGRSGKILVDEDFQILGPVGRSFPQNLKFSLPLFLRNWLCQTWILQILWKNQTEILERVWLAKCPYIQPHFHS